MGRVPYGPVPGQPNAEGPQPDIFDFFRFTSAGSRLIEGGATASPAYFSVDGGNTKLADYGQTSDASDFLNSGVQGYNDPFNEFYSGSTSQTLTLADIQQLDALGFHTTTIVVAATASQAVPGGPAVALLSGPPTITDLASANLSGATIKIADAGGNVVAGDALYINGQQSGTVDGGLVAVSWNSFTKSLNLVGNISIAAYETLLSEITYQDAGTDPGSHRTVTWTVNDGMSNFSTTSQIAIDPVPVVTAANVVLNANLTTVAASSLFTASDSDGDAITSYALKDSGNGHFVLNGVAQANNQEIDVTAAQLSQLTYQSAGGTDQLQVRVNDGTFWSTWQSFSVTGPAATVIEAFGSTSLVRVGNNYYLDSNSSGTGPELKDAGAVVTAGEFGTWAPIGAEQTASGYDVAWKDPATGQYTVWGTDGNGNFVSSVIPVATGTDIALESIETTFHQDLNGDGVIGISPSHTRPALELAGTSPDPVTFASSPSILMLDTPSTFTGQITGFGGDGTLAGSDQIDMRGMNYRAVHSNYDDSTGILDISDGTTTVDIKFAGTYSQANFKFADDGGRGTIVYDQPASGQSISPGAAAGATTGTSPPNLLVTATQDTFVFAPNFGQVTVANFNPAKDTIQIGQSIFANMTALLAATRDDGHGNAVITDAAHDTITLQHTTVAQLLAHQSDFHFV